MKEYQYQFQVLTYFNWELQDPFNFASILHYVTLLNYLFYIGHDFKLRSSNTILTIVVNFYMYFTVILTVVVKFTCILLYVQNVVVI